MPDSIAGQFLKESRRRLLEDRRKLRFYLDQLGDGELWWQPNDGANSVGIIIFHTHESIRQWMGELAGVPYERARQFEFESRPDIDRASLLAMVDDAVDNAVAVIDNIDPATLTEPIVVQGFEETKLTTIYVTVAHFGEHVGQISLLAQARRGSTFEPAWVPANPAQGAPVEEDRQG